jgi:hypothetical protein
MSLFTAVFDHKKRKEFPMVHMTRHTHGDISGET